MCWQSVQICQSSEEIACWELHLMVFGNLFKFEEIACWELHLMVQVIPPTRFLTGCYSHLFRICQFQVLELFQYTGWAHPPDSSAAAWSLCLFPHSGTSQSSSGRPSAEPSSSSGPFSAWQLAPRPRCGQAGPEIRSQHQKRRPIKSHLDRDYLEPHDLALQLVPLPEEADPLLVLLLQLLLQHLHLEGIGQN